MPRQTSVDELLETFLNSLVRLKLFGLVAGLGRDALTVVDARFGHGSVGTHGSVADARSFTDARVGCGSVFFLIY